MIVKALLRSHVLAAAVLLLIGLPSQAAAQGARLDLSHLNRLTSKATNVVDVNVDRAMLEQTAGLLSGKGTDADAMKRTLADIVAIYVRSFEFGAPGAYSQDDVEIIRRQLTGQGWSRVIGVREKDEISEIYIWSDKGTNGGLAVIAAEPNELTVVNIVGRVDLASLASLGPLIPKLPGGATGGGKR